MRLFCALALALAAAPAMGSTLYVGAGLTYFAASAETAPFVGAVIGLTPVKAIHASWDRNSNTERVAALGGFRVGVLPGSLGSVEALGGLDVSWEKWESWYPEAAFGLCLNSSYAGFVSKAQWLRTQRGGAATAANSYSLGLYLCHGGEKQ